MKRKLSLLMVLMMIVSLVPMSAFAAAPVANSESAPGFVGGTEITVDISTSSVITFEPGSTITFDSRDEVETTNQNIVVSGNVATVRENAQGPFAFDVELGDEAGLRKVIIRGANGRVEELFYANVLVSGKSGAELLQKKVVFPRDIDAELASFVLRSPGTGKATLTLPKDFTWNASTAVIGGGATNIQRNGSVLTFDIVNNTNVVVNPVVNARRAAAFGDVEVAIDTKDITADLVIGEFVDYNVVVKVDKEREVLAGDVSDTIKVTLDGVAGAFTNREITFTLDGAKLVGTPTLTGATFEEVKDSDRDEFYIRPTSPLSSLKKIEVEFKVDSLLRSRGGVATLTVEGAGVERQTVDLITVNPRANFETTVQDIRVTNVATKTSNIVITENAAGALPASTTAHVIRFQGTDAPRIVAAKVEVEGNIEVDVEVKDGEILLTVERASRREGSVITIKDVEVTVPRATLPGKYDLRMLASGTTRLADWTYVNVLEPGALVRKTTVFTLDSAVFTVDGEQMMLDAAPYISNNRTMLPIGTMAQLLGATVNYSPATRTAVFSRDNLVVSMNLDTNVLLVNGVPVMMDAKPEIKNDRAFVPVVFVAQAFGVQNGVDIVFDAATRTVTLFPNN